MTLEKFGDFAKKSRENPQNDLAKRGNLKIPIVYVDIVSRAIN
jgi:hypothetical protein